MENRSTWRTTPFTDRSPVSVGDWLRWGSRASLPTWHRVTRRTVDARVGVRQGSAPSGSAVGLPGPPRLPGRQFRAGVQGSGLAEALPAAPATSASGGPPFPELRVWGAQRHLTLGDPFLPALTLLLHLAPAAWGGRACLSPAPQAGPGPAEQRAPLGPPAPPPPRDSGASFLSLGICDLTSKAAYGNPVTAGSGSKALEDLDCPRPPREGGIFTDSSETPKVLVGSRSDPRAAVPLQGQTKAL